MILKEVLVIAFVKFEQFNPDFITIPSWFITDYMPQALGGYVKVYLYLITLYQKNSSDMTLEDVAKKLDMLYSEFLSALEYWNNEKVITFQKLSDDEFDLQFATLPPATSTRTEKVDDAGNTIVQKAFMQQTRPHYTTDEIALYKKQHHSISNLFLICEKYLGRLLSTSDQQIIYGFYDWLNMPLDLIEFLIEYCASNNHTHIRYIEKVALSWSEQGIKTVSDAKGQVATSQKYRQILKALGMNGETITKHQRDLLDKWMDEYKLSVAIILEGCNRTVTYSSRPSLNYLGSILESWYKQGVKTVDDINKLDKAHTQTTTTPAGKKTTSKNPHFTSTYSHNWDLDELEKRESQYIDNKLYGGN